MGGGRWVVGGGGWEVGGFLLKWFNLPFYMNGCWPTMEGEGRTCPLSCWFLWQLLTWDAIGGRPRPRPLHHPAICVSEIRRCVTMKWLRVTMRKRSIHRPVIIQWVIINIYTWKTLNRGRRPPPSYKWGEMRWRGGGVKCTANIRKFNTIFQFIFHNFLWMM